MNLIKKQRNGGGGGQTSNESVSYFEHLPKPLCQEIFVRIPARDIMHCKLVCKPWYKILGQPSFAILYAKRSPFSTIIVRAVIYSRKPQLGLNNLILPGIPWKSNEVWYLVEFSNNGDFVWTGFKPTLPASLIENSTFDVSSSCNGLLCLTVHTPALDIVCISNPVLGECFALPQHEKDQPGDYVKSRYILGFVPSMNRFKVVRIVCERGEDRITKCEILTIGVDNTWRGLENVFISYPYWEKTMLCHYGVLHWIPRVDTSCGVYTFDLAEEKRGLILNPPGVGVNWRTMILKLYGNQLCLVDNSDQTQITIWTMKESWTKDVVLKSWFPSGMTGNSLEIALVGKSRNGDMFFLTSDSTFYKVTDKTCSEIGVLLVESDTGSLELYEPSFLSLKEFMVKGTQE
ncbi:hypothetical protein ACJIZ3_015729 [Penstemon smallii]|uniref:F-box domain-containing protein n=1 Tax=Penstemon smallii TaxID=265156 RepID=A0ABD3RR86_9LAMI